MCVNLDLVERPGVGGRIYGQVEHRCSRHVRL